MGLEWSGGSGFRVEWWYWVVGGVCMVDLAGLVLVGSGLSGGSECRVEW